MLEQFERERDPTLDQFSQAIEVMTMIEKHYTPEQQRQLEQRRDSSAMTASAKASATGPR